jgi:hypothetical protein
MGGIVDTVLGRSDKPINALQNFRPVGLNAGGFNFNVNRERVSGGSTPERRGLVTNLSNLFGQQAGQIRALRPQVAPGFGRLTEAGLATFGAARERLEANRRRAVGNLRENLARRRVLGSSFASDALARADAEFEQEERELTAQEAAFRAQSFLQELDLTRQLIGEEFTAARGAVQVFLQNLNLEAEIASRLAGSATNALAANAQMQSQLLQEQANNAQGFLTELMGIGAGLAAFGINPFHITPATATTVTRTP